MISRPSGLSRRELLAQGLSLTSLAMLGCSRETEPTPSTPATSRSSVPLRVLIVSESESSQSLSRAWSASDDGELKLQSVTIPRSEAGRLSAEVAELAGKTDVLIYPLLLAGDLFHQSALVALDPESLDVRSDDDSQDNVVRLATALKTGVSRFADQSIGLPLGGMIPALFTVDAIESPKTWEDYDAIVSGPLMGQASEPTAPGWAGAMFLWRSVSTARDGWLFDRESMKPLVATPSYVEALELMKQTHDRYASKRMSPESIWTNIQQGTLRGGITYPPPNIEAFPDIQVINMPSGNSIQRVLFDPFTPVASISAACRQSVYAKKFIAWLASADGASALNQCISGAKQVIKSEQSGVEATVSNSPYDSFLDEVWKTPLTSPGLQIIHGGAYYEALDTEIGKVLDKKSEPAEALEIVARKWAELTQTIGVKNQLRVWNQAQGRRG